MIHAVIFDFGNVICTFDLQPFLRRISRSSKKSLSELQGILPSFRDVAIEYESGSITSDHFFEEIRKRSELSISKEEFITAYCEIFVPVSSTFDLIRRLKKNYKLGLVSNTSEWHYQYGIRPVAIYPLFDAVTLSFEVKAMKPARAVYDDILAKLLVHPHDCVFIDDIKENVDAANDLGMRGIHYTSSEALIRSLHGLNIVF